MKQVVLYDTRRKSQLPKINKMLNRYTLISSEPIHYTVAELESLSKKIQCISSMIGTANPNVSNVVSLDLYPFMTGKTNRRAIPSHALDLAPLARPEDTHAMLRNMHILRSRKARLDIMAGELRRIARKEEDTVIKSMSELEGLRDTLEQLPDGAASNTGKQFAFVAIQGAIFGFIVSRFNSALEMILFPAIGVAVSVGIAALRLKILNRSAEWADSLKPYEAELKELSKSFKERYKAFTESILQTIEKSSQGLDELAVNLLPYVPERDREKIMSYLEFLDAQNF